jgi:hypothetical protein
MKTVNIEFWDGEFQRKQIMTINLKTTDLLALPKSRKLYKITAQGNLIRRYNIHIKV